jgi:Mn-dependent DtxR family transcriptional regulator
VCRILTCLEEANPKASHNLTHQTMACLIGAHRVTVTDVIAKLKNEGIIKTEKNGFITVKKFEKLRDIAVNI